MTNKILYRASDGKIFEDYDKGVIHQKVLAFNGDTGSCEISLDGGKNWDYKYGAHGWERKEA